MGNNQKTKDIMKTICATILLAGSVLGQNVAGPQYQYKDQRTEQWSEPDIVSSGEWVTVGDSSDPFGAAQQPPARNPFGLDIKPILRYGLGAVILMLIVSTAISVGQKFWPLISKLIPATEMDSARSLEQMSSLAQYAFGAFEKYQALNEEKN